MTDTKIILIPCIVTEILTKESFSVMAALICVLGKCPRQQSGIIPILKEHTSKVSKEQKKLCTDGIARFSKNLGLVNRTIPFSHYIEKNINIPGKALLFEV